MIESHQLNKQIPIPLYFQLKTILLDAIKNGEYPINSMIPTENELSEMFHISRTTVRQAITELVQEGWLYRIASKGTFVARLKVKQDFIKRLESFNDQILRSGCVPSTRLLEIKRCEMPPFFRAHFGLNDGGDYVYIHRLRFADAEPIVTVETYLPYDLCNFVMKHDFNRESMYNILSLEQSTSIWRVNRIIEATEATAKDSEFLNIQRGKPVLLSTTVGYNFRDEPIEFSYARYRGDRNRFEVELLTENSQ